MENGSIVELYWTRSEDAILETEKKYGRYCLQISYNILKNNEDAKECVNDTYVNAWNAIPPNRPQRLSTFLGKITRNLSLQRYRKNCTAKRGGGQVPLVLDELEDCIPTISDVDHAIDEKVLSDVLSEFLMTLQKTERIVFVRRYWYLCSIKDIARMHGMSESKAKSILYRTRNKLKTHLKKEGIYV